MLVVSTPSATTVSGQTASNRVSLRTSSPACVTKYTRRSKVLGRNVRRCSPSQRHALSRSSWKRPKRQRIRYSHLLAAEKP
jgi:hypothetical protein